MSYYSAGEIDDLQNAAYAEGRRDEREALIALCTEEAMAIRKEGQGCTDSRYDWMAQGLENLAETFRGLKA